MPCESEEQCRDFKERLERCRYRSKKMEARLYALLNELERRDVDKCSDIIEAAEKKGQIRIKGVWREYKEVDKVQLKLVLKELFSPDELDFIRQILGES